EGTNLIAAHDWAWLGGKVTGRILDNDSSGISTGEKHHGIRHARAWPQYRFIGIGKIHHKLPFQISPFSGKTAIGDCTEVSCCNETANRHFARWIRFPISAASSRGQRGAISGKRSG